MCVELGLDNTYLKFNIHIVYKGLNTYHFVIFIFTIQQLN